MVSRQWRPSSSRASSTPVEHAREAADVAERRAQVVRHGVGEGLELLVGRVELGGASPDALLELGVEATDLLLRPHARGDVADRGDARRAVPEGEEAARDLDGEPRSVLATVDAHRSADDAAPCGRVPRVGQKLVGVIKAEVEVP